MAEKFKNLVGMRFGRLVVVEPSERRQDTHKRWVCRCDCGAVIEVNSSNLTRGTSKSCGCYRRDRDHGNENVRHAGSRGGKKERLYRIWGGIKQRCNNPKATGFARYGGRGITVCDEWQNNYSAFKEWALSNGYADDLTIDRIDNDKGYSPQNCRWTTPAEQLRNRSPYTKPNAKKPLYTINGTTRTAQEWGEMIGISGDAFTKRMRKGLPPDLVLKPNRYKK